MIIPRSIRGVALATAALMSLSPVLANAAQHHPRHYHRHQYYAVAPQQPRCAPWCPSDINPCDPVQFKIADGRCVDDWN
jgi:hypothetical protein